MARKPNILLIHADQMRYDCASFSGNPDVKTPHLDRLAMEGVCFDEAFASYPLCRPFRASFQTGKYPQRTGAYDNFFTVDPNQPSLARVLNAVGYKSGYFGKWHLYSDLHPGFVPPGPGRMGYDHFVGFDHGHRYMNAIFYRDSVQPYTCRRFEPDFQTDHAIEFMEGAYASGAPFLAYVSFGPPHIPMIMPEHWSRMYDPARIALPKGAANYLPEGPRTLTGEDRRKLASEPNLKTETEEWKIRKFVSGYYSLISSIDFNIGRLLNWLDAMALAENTIVIFFSDHGDMLGQHGSYCGRKNLPYRAAAQVPLLVRCGGRFACGKRVDSLVDVAVDTMPTLLQSCGVEAPEDMQGISYLALLEGGDKPTRDHLPYQRIKRDRYNRDANPLIQRGIRTKDWLYVRDRNRPLHLFDQNADRDEMVNLIGDPGHAENLAELDARLRRNMDATGDDWEFGTDFKRPGSKAPDVMSAYMLILKNAVIEVP